MAAVSIYSSLQNYTHEPSNGISVKDWLTLSPRNSPGNVLKDCGNTELNKSARKSQTAVKTAEEVNAPQEEARQPWSDRSLAHQLVNGRLAESLEKVKRRSKAATIIQRAFLGKTGSSEASNGLSSESKDEKLVRLERELKLSTATNLKVRKEMELWLKDRDAISATMEGRKMVEFEKKLEEKDRELERVGRKNRTQSKQLDKVLKDNGELRSQLGDASQRLITQLRRVEDLESTLTTWRKKHRKILVEDTMKDPKNGRKPAAEPVIDENQVV